MHCFGFLAEAIAGDEHRDVEDFPVRHENLPEGRARHLPVQDVRHEDFACQETYGFVHPSTTAQHG